MRETCLLCVSKHIAQATILTAEAALGYPIHLWYAVGHLAEAEHESLSEYPSIAKTIRSVRVKLMGQEAGFDALMLPDLLSMVRAQCAEVNGYSEEKRVEIILKGGNEL